MVSSIERYGAPFTIGGLYLTAFLALNGKKPKTGAIACMIFVLLTTDYTSAYRALIGYRDTVEEVMAQRGEIVDEKAESFLDKVDGAEKGSVGRVLYLRDISDVSWVRNTYVGFEAAPVSVMYGNVDATSAESQDIVNALLDAHANFLYVDELTENGEALFETLLEDSEFEYSCLYKIIEEAGNLRLVKF